MALGAFLTRGLVYKAGVLAVTVALAGLGAWGAADLRQEFDPAWFLPKDSYLFHWSSITSK